MEIGDFAQRDDRVFVVVPINRKLGAGRDHAGAMRRQQDQIEPVVDLINAIFYGDARHRLSPSLMGPNMLIMAA